MDVYGMVPVNKTASLVTNQSGVSDKIEINGLVQERIQLKANVITWTEQSRKSTKHKYRLRPFLKSAHLRLGRLKKILKTYDQKNKEFIPKTYAETLVMVIKRTIDPEIVRQMEITAKGIWHDT